MRGKIVHTVVAMTGPGDWRIGDITLKPTKSSPGYEAYFPTYKLLSERGGTAPSGLKFDVTVKGFRGAYVIVEARAEFESAAAKEILAAKDELNEAAARVALEFSDLRMAEEYTFYLVSDYSGPESFVRENRLMIAQMLKDDALELTETEIEQTLASSIRYARDDMTVIEWDGALLLDREGDFEDNMTLIELANIQLLALRALDDRLTGEIGLFKGFGDFRTPNIFRLSRFLRSIINVRSRSLLDLDEIDNSIKLYGDWYSAKLYSAAARKLYLASWREAVEEKLELLEKMFEMVSQRQGEIYNVTLEISIVLLIALEIVLIVYGVG